MLKKHNELKKIQRELLIKCLIWAIPLFLLALFFLIHIKYEFTLLICFILTCLILFIPISIYNDKFSTIIIEKQILPNIKEQLCKSISFDKDNQQKYKPSSHPLNDSWGVYLNRWNNITNVISGSINGVNFKIADANTSSSFCAFPFTSFYGQIIELSYNNSFDGEIFIKPKKIYNRNFCNRCTLNKEYTIEKHAVYTKNNNDSYNDFLFIKYFIEHYNKKMYVHIVTNKIFVMIESNNSLLNQFNLFYLKKYSYQNLRLIFELIKHIGART